MANTVGRLGWAGIAIEGTAGTYTTPADFINYTANNLIGKHTPFGDIQAYGVREKDFSSAVGKQWGEGDITANLAPITAGYFFRLATNVETKTTVSGSVTDHVFTVSGTNTPTTASITFDKGAYREKFVYACLKDFEIDVKDGLATIKAGILSQMPTTTTSGTNTPAAETLLSFKD